MKRDVGLMALAAGILAGSLHLSADEAISSATPSEIIAPKNHRIVAARKLIQQIKATANGTIRRTNKKGLAASNRTPNRMAVHVRAWGYSPAAGFATGPTIGPASTAALICTM